MKSSLERLLPGTLYMVVAGLRIYKYAIPFFNVYTIDSQHKYFIFYIKEIWSIDV